MLYRSNLINCTLLIGSLFYTNCIQAAEFNEPLHENNITLYVEQAISETKDQIDELFISAVIDTNTEIAAWDHLVNTIEETYSNIEKVKRSHPSSTAAAVAADFHAFLLGNLFEDGRLGESFSYYLNAPSKRHSTTTKNRSIAYLRKNYCRYSDDSADFMNCKNEIYVDAKTDSEGNSSLKGGFTYNKDKEEGPFSANGESDITRNDKGDTTYSTSVGFSVTW